jgi:cysteine desulfurase/selenocysteine lyase
MREHHSNILPWQTLSRIFGFTIEFVKIDENYDIDRSDFSEKYNDAVKVVSLSHVSNVTGKIIDVAKIKTLLREDTFFIVDGSQSIPHFPVNVREIGCDAFVMTAHKMMGYTGLGMLCLKYQWIKELTPLILGGGTVKDVSQTDFSLQGNSDKWETGTPNIIGAISLLKALEFIHSIGGMEAIWKHEQKLVQLSNKGFKERSGKVKVIGSLSDEERVGVYAFLLPESNFNKIGEEFAKENICIRAGGHCAYPLHKFLNIGGSSRMSSYVYNDEEDLKKFFGVLDKFIG